MFLLPNGIIPELTGYRLEPNGAINGWLEGEENEHRTNILFVLDGTSEAHICKAFTAFRSFTNETLPVYGIQQRRSFIADCGQVALKTINNNRAGEAVNLYLSCRYIQESSYNIISLQKLRVDFGMEIEFSSDRIKCYVKNNQFTLLFEKNDNGLYVSNMMILPEYAFEPSPDVIINV